MPCFDWIPTRVILGIMSFLMFVVTQMIRTNLYMALIAINLEKNGNVTEIVTERATWNENAPGLLLGAFYWSYWATELPGGLLANKFGGRKVLGFGVTVAAIVNLLIPFACDRHYLFASFLRAVQGLALGVTWPVMHWFYARWIPKTERSKFMTSYHGTAIGNVITYVMSGIIITYLGWKYVFYIVGCLALIWCLAWWILVFDSPSSHPRITKTELDYLKSEIGDLASSMSKKVETPWRAIISSPPVWALLMVSQAIIWGIITLQMQIPQYFHQVHQLDIKTNGVLTGLPDIGKFILSLTFSAFMDRMISKKVLTIIAVRKLSVAVSLYVPAVLMILLGFFGSSSTALAFVFLALAATAGGANSSGSLSNIIDISPIHAGTILGVIKTFSFIPGVVSPLMASYFTRNCENSLQAAKQWRIVFIILAMVYFVSCTTFLLFASGDVQSWNKPKITPKEEVLLLEMEKFPPKVIEKSVTKEGSLKKENGCRSS